MGALWAFANSPVGVALVSGVALFLLGRLFTAKPGWRATYDRYRGLFFDAVRYAEKAIPDGTEDRAAAKADAALKWLLKMEPALRGENEADLHAAISEAHDTMKATSPYEPRLPAGYGRGALPDLKGWLWPVFLVGLLGLAGCVSPAVHANAAKLQTTLDVLARATIPDPRYSDPAAPEYNPRAAVKVDELWAEAQSSVAAILEASK